MRDAIQIAQRIEAASKTELPNTSGFQLLQKQQYLDSTATPMDIDVQNAQTQTAYRRSLPAKDAQGHPKCFFCNNYGHVNKYCRKLKQQQQNQKSQIFFNQHTVTPTT